MRNSYPIYEQPYHARDGAVYAHYQHYDGHKDPYGYSDHYEYRDPYGYAAPHDYYHYSDPSGYYGDW